MSNKGLQKPPILKKILFLIGKCPILLERKKERKKEHIFSDFHRVVNQLLGVVFLYLLNAFASISTFSYQNESKNGEKAYFEQGTRCATHIGWSKYTTRKD